MRLTAVIVGGVAFTIALIGASEWETSLATSPIENGPSHGNREGAAADTLTPTGVRSAPFFTPPPGWHTSSSGPQLPGSEDQPSAWVSNQTYPLAPYRVPLEELKTLPPDGIVIVASIIASERYPAPPSVNFPDRYLPVVIADAEIMKAWEGQVAPNVPLYLILARVKSQYLEVRAYFGTLDPSPSRLQEAAEALRGLVVPDRV